MEAAGKGMSSRPRLPSHFYETITHRPDHPIRISTLFMKRHGDNLGGSVFLRDSGPGGAEWEVDLKDINGGAWLEKGWKEFVQFYSIKPEYLVMFNYQGNSRFRVIICDKTGNEISYPVDPRLETLPVKAEPVEEDGPVFVSKVRGKRNSNNLEISSTVVKGRRLRKRIAGQDSDGSCAKVFSASSEKEKVNACERAFKSENPYFATMMKATNIDSYHQLVNIPSYFWRSNFDGKSIGGQGLKFKLHLPNEETMWPVVVERYRMTERGDYGRIYGAGWTKLAEDIKLTVGEVCIFELLMKEKAFIVYRFN